MLHSCFICWQNRLTDATRRGRSTTLTSSSESYVSSDVAYRNWSELETSTSFWTILCSEVMFISIEVPRGAPSRGSLDHPFNWHKSPQRALGLARWVRINRPERQSVSAPSTFTFDGCGISKTVLSPFIDAVCSNVKVHCKWHKCNIFKLQTYLGMNA